MLDWVQSTPLTATVPFPVSSNSKGKVSGTFVVKVVLFVAAAGKQIAKINTGNSTNNIALERIFDLAFIIIRIRLGK